MNTLQLIRRNPFALGIVGVVAGLLIGYLLGFNLTPVQNTAPAQLAQAYRDNYLRLVAGEFSRAGETAAALDRIRVELGLKLGPNESIVDNWTDAQVAARLGQLATQNQTSDPAQARDLMTLSNAIRVAADIPSAPPSSASSPASANMVAQILPLCGVAILAAALISAGWLFLTRRRSAQAEQEKVEATGYRPGMLASASNVSTSPLQSNRNGGDAPVPLARFTSTYTLGEDNFDDSFSIDTSAGEFLGECGVGISETIGTGEPKKVTALEVWLFDKNDIRTVTKVVMSQHAFEDDALRAKLMPKGEAVLARAGDTVSLDTASLVIHARIIELDYGSGALPPHSFFNKLVLELTALTKQGEIQVQETADS